MTKKLAEAISIARYTLKFKRFPHLNHPRDLNEKIMWLQYRGDSGQWPRLSDKHLAREYVREKGLGDILVRQLGCYASADDIDFDALPDRFVAKMNNGYGNVHFVTDKASTDLEALRATLRSDLRKKFGFFTGEPHYLLIEPRIVIEELLPVDKDLSSSLVDYKFWCFNGKPHVCLVCSDRDFTTHRLHLNTYSLPAWKHLESDMHPSVHNTKQIPRPRTLGRMMEIAAILSEGFPCVRVDLYEVNGKVYFSELTFSSNGARMRYYTDEALVSYGRLIRLP